MDLDIQIFTKFDENFTLDVSWSMNKELVVLFGYSGSGKTLTLKTIAGLVKQDKGFIRHNGRILFDADKKINLKPQLRKIGYVFQDLALFPHLTIEKNILFGAKNLSKEIAKEKTHQMLETFRLTGLEKKFPHQISGGQKQRVAFARALISSPDIFLLDEPFSSLDNPLRFEMRECLANVIKKKFKIPAILVTHDVLEASTLADKILVYSKGKIIQFGTPQEIFKNPINDEVKILFKCN